MDDVTFLQNSLRDLKKTPPSSNAKLEEVSNRGDNWVHPALSAAEIPGCGLGLITNQDIAKGTLLVVYGGKVLTTEELVQLPEQLSHYPYQIDDDLFLGPTSIHSLGLGEMINHSCDPNCGFVSEIRLAARRDISFGEQITFDYGTCVCSEIEVFSMRCACGSAECRGWITGEDWQLTHLQDRLYPFFQPFLQRKIAATKSLATTSQYYEPQSDGTGRSQGSYTNGHSKLTKSIEKGIE